MPKTTTMPAQSSKRTLNSIDRKKIGKGALIALGGALLTYLQDLIPQVDFGQWTPIVMALNSVLVNWANKLLTGK